MCLVEEVQGSCWRGAWGVICEAVGSKWSQCCTEERYGDVVSKRRF